MRSKFGIRMTLGATPGNVRRLIYRRGEAAGRVAADPAVRASQVE